jgi:hypothetical protein
MGSLFRTPKAPAPINVAAVGQQQAAENTRSAQQQAAYNRPNQTDAFGNTVNWSQSGTDANGNPVFQVNQQLGATGQRMAGGLGGLADRYFDQAGGSSGIDRALGMYDQTMDPRNERMRAAAESRLRNQGFDPSSEAFRTQMSDVALQQNEARNNFATGAWGQAINERGQQMRELSPGVQFGMGTTSPQMVNAPGVNVGTVDYGQLNNMAYQQQANVYNQQMQQRNAMLGGLSGIGGSILSAPVGGGASVGGSLFTRLLGGGGGGGGGLSPGMIQAMQAQGIPLQPGKYGPMQ